VTEADPREALVAAARRLDAAGFMPTKSGNLSLRTARGFWITPSGLPYADLSAEDCVELDADGARLAGQALPSSEWRLHAAILAARPDVTAVVHTHSPFASALACARCPIPPFHYMIALAGGDTIPCADYATFGTEALARSAVAALGATLRAALLANHGVVTLGVSLRSAEALAGEVENLARQFLALRAAGLTPVQLTSAEMADVTRQFASYGRLR
jgi:L-fuculose-phosphate aldolase